MSRRAGAVWFIGVTVAAVGTELLFALDGDGGTVPWTGYLTRLPWWALAPLVLGFSVWLPWHLWDAKRRAEQRAADHAGMKSEARADAEQQPTDR